MLDNLTKPNPAAGRIDPVTTDCGLRPVENKNMALCVALQARLQPLERRLL
jgi:hypothetical protein